MQEQKRKTIDYSLTCHFNNEFLGIVLQHIGKKEYYMFMYDHSASNKYLGFLNLLDFIKFEPHDENELLKMGFPLSLHLPEAHTNLILLTCLNRVFVVGNTGNNHWENIRILD